MTSPSGATRSHTLPLMYVMGNTTIRAVEPNDLGATRRWRNDPRVFGPALGRRFPITETGERTWFEELGQGQFPTQVVWTIADESDSAIGLVQLTDIHWIHRTAMFGIWVGPEHRGNGHASRATQLACRHGFDALGLRQIRLEVLEDHEAAHAVYAKNGFRDEGLLRGAVLLDGRPQDLRVMLLSASSAVPDRRA